MYLKNCPESGAQLDRSGCCGCQAPKRVHRQKRLRTFGRRMNRILDWLFRGLAAWNGLWCLAMVDKLERDVTYPLAKGAVLVGVFLALTVLCLWLGNCYPEWLGRRPLGGGEKR